MTLSVSASLSSFCPTILTKGNPSSLLACSASVAAEALHRIARRDLPEVARGHAAAMGVPAREDAIDAIVRGGLLLAFAGCAGCAASGCGVGARSRRGPRGARHPIRAARRGGPTAGAKRGDLIGPGRGDLKAGPFFRPRSSLEKLHGRSFRFHRRSHPDPKRTDLRSRGSTTGSQQRR